MNTSRATRLRETRTNDIDGTASCMRQDRTNIVVTVRCLMIGNERWYIGGGKIRMTGG